MIIFSSGFWIPVLFLQNRVTKDTIHKPIFIVLKKIKGPPMFLI